MAATRTKGEQPPIPQEATKTGIRRIDSFYFDGQEYEPQQPDTTKATFDEEFKDDDPVRAFIDSGKSLTYIDSSIGGEHSKYADAGKGGNQDSAARLKHNGLEGTIVADGVGGGDGQAGKEGSRLAVEGLQQFLSSTKPGKEGLRSYIDKAVDFVNNHVVKNRSGRDSGTGKSTLTGFLRRENSNEAAIFNVGDSHTEVYHLDFEAGKAKKEIETHDAGAVAILVKNKDNPAFLKAIENGCKMQDLKQFTSSAEGEPTMLHGVSDIAVQANFIMTYIFQKKKYFSVKNGKLHDKRIKGPITEAHLYNHPDGNVTKDVIGDHQQKAGKFHKVNAQTFEVKKNHLILSCSDPINGLISPFERKRVIEGAMKAVAKAMPDADRDSDEYRKAVLKAINNDLTAMADFRNNSTTGYKMMLNQNKRVDMPPVNTADAQGDIVPNADNRTLTLELVTEGKEDWKDTAKNLKKYLKGALARARAGLKRAEATVEEPPTKQQAEAPQETETQEDTRYEMLKPGEVVDTYTTKESPFSAEEIDHRDIKTADDQTEIRETQTARIYAHTHWGEGGKYVTNHPDRKNEDVFALTTRKDGSTAIVQVDSAGGSGYGVFVGAQAAKSTINWLKNLKNMAGDVPMTDRMFEAVRGINQRIFDRIPELVDLDKSTGGAKDTAQDEHKNKGYAALTAVNISPELKVSTLALTDGDVFMLRPSADGQTLELVPAGSAIRQNGGTFDAGNDDSVEYFRSADKHKVSAAIGAAKDMFKHADFTPEFIEQIIRNEDDKAGTPTDESTLPERIEERLFQLSLQTPQLMEAQGQPGDLLFVLSDGPGDVTTRTDFLKEIDTLWAQGIRDIAELGQAMETILEDRITTPAGQQFGLETANGPLRVNANPAARDNATFIAVELKGQLETEKTSTLQYLRDSLDNKYVKNAVRAGLGLVAAGILATGAWKLSEGPQYQGPPDAPPAPNKLTDGEKAPELPEGVTIPDAAPNEDGGDGPDPEDGGEPTTADTADDPPLEDGFVFPPEDVSPAPDAQDGGEPTPDQPEPTPEPTEPDPEDEPVESPTLASEIQKGESHHKAARRIVKKIKDMPDGAEKTAILNSLKETYGDLGSNTALLHVFEKDLLKQGRAEIIKKGGVKKKKLDNGNIEMQVTYDNTFTGGDISITFDADGAAIKFPETKATNITMVYEWDPQKRRIVSSKRVETPRAAAPEKPQENEGILAQAPKPEEKQQATPEQSDKEKIAALRAQIIDQNNPDNAAPVTGEHETVGPTYTEAGPKVQVDKALAQEAEANAASVEVSSEYQRDTNRINRIVSAASKTIGFRQRTGFTKDFSFDGFKAHFAEMKDKETKTQETIEDLNAAIASTSFFGRISKKHRENNRKRQEAEESLAIIQEENTIKTNAMKEIWHTTLAGNPDEFLKLFT